MTDFSVLSVISLMPLEKVLMIPVHKVPPGVLVLLDLYTQIEFKNNIKRATLFSSDMSSVCQY